MSWCLMSSDVIWHIRDKLWPMPKHGSIKSTYVRCKRVLAVTCHLHFWQNDRDFLRATVVTRGWNGYRNKSQHRKSTLENKILPPFQQGFEPATFQSRVWCSNHWAIPAPYNPLVELCTLYLLHSYNPLVELCTLYLLHSYNPLVELCTLYLLHSYNPLVELCTLYLLHSYNPLVELCTLYLLHSYNPLVELCTLYLLHSYNPLVELCTLYLLHSYNPLVELCTLYLLHSYNPLVELCTLYLLHSYNPLVELCTLYLLHSYNPLVELCTLYLLHSYNPLVELCTLYLLHSYNPLVELCTLYLLHSYNPLVELCTLYFLTCQVGATVGDSHLCCVCVTSVLIHSLACWFCTSALGLLFQMASTQQFVSLQPSLSLLTFAHLEMLLCAGQSLCYGLHHLCSGGAAACWLATPGHLTCMGLRLWSLGVEHAHHTQTADVSSTPPKHGIHSGAAAFGVCVA